MTTEDMMEKNKDNIWICEICKKKVKGCILAMALTGHHKSPHGNNCEGLFFPKNQEVL